MPCPPGFPASYLASILGAAVVFAGWRDGRWSILARSSSGAELRLLPDDDFTLDEVTGLAGDAIAVREVGGAPWTLASLPAAEHTALLMIEGDWSGSTHALAEAARALCAPEGSTSLGDIGLAKK